MKLLPLMFVMALICTLGCCCLPSAKPAATTTTTTTTLAKPECTIDADCGNESLCLYGSCYQQDQVKGFECTSDDDCFSGETCVRGYCIYK
jgi:hypothetical protein